MVALAGRKLTHDLRAYAAITECAHVLHRQWQTLVRVLVARRLTSELLIPNNSNSRVALALIAK